VRGATVGFLAGVALAALVIACAGHGTAMVERAPGPAPLPPDPRTAKMTEIMTLWGQIRDWRHDAHMTLEPSPTLQFQWKDRSFRDIKRVCPDGHEVPKTCSDVCSLSDDICENAELICRIADELGKSDVPAQEKCTSAKASCRESKQRCCDCTGGAAP
jgi:hypothetical protein